MGTNKRYGDRLTERTLDRRNNGGRRPVDLPKTAHGHTRMQWVKPARPVWAWVYWTDGTVERIATVAHGWNDRVVEIAVPGGYATIWRSGVTHRTVSDT